MATKQPLQWMKIDGFVSEVIVTEGAHLSGVGKIAGVFASEEDARGDDPDNAAIGSVAWHRLTPEQQKIAEENSAALCD